MQIGPQPQWSEIMWQFICLSGYEGVSHRGGNVKIDRHWPKAEERSRSNIAGHLPLSLQTRTNKLKLL